MKLKKRKPKRLYNRYLEENEEIKEKEAIAVAEGVSAEKIEIKKVKVPFFAKMIEILVDVFFGVMKWLGRGVVIGLSCIGLTVLVNGNMREDFFSQIIIAFQSIM